MHNTGMTTAPRTTRQPRTRQVRTGALTQHRKAAAGALTAVLTSLLLLTACGGGGSGDPNGSSGGGSGSSGRSSQNNPAKFSQCMRSHGVPTFPDANSSGQFQLQVTKGGALDPNSATFKTALQTCHKYDTSFGNNSNSSSNSSALLAFAKCMRSHGVTNFPDPKSGGRMQLGGGIQSNPHFNSAMQACRSLLPGGGS